MCSFSAAASGIDVHSDIEIHVVAARDERNIPGTTEAFGAGDGMAC